MKKLHYLIVWIILANAPFVFAQKTAGIGTDKPNPKAVLELTVENSVTFPQGLLLPRLTTTERNLLASGTIASLTGMAVYDLTDKTFYTWDGTQWKSTGNLLTTIVGTNGIVISTSGNSFTVDGSNLKSQWISASSNQIYTNSFVGIGTNNPNGLLQFPNTDNNRKIVLHEDANNDFQFYGLGIGTGHLRYSVGSAGGSHRFYAGTSSATAVELMRIQGDGNVGIGTLTPNEKLTIQGNSSVSGIGYFSTISGLALNGATAGSIVTVDGLGKLGFGTLTIPQSQWISASSNQIYTNSFVGINTILNPYNDVMVVNGNGKFSGVVEVGDNAPGNTQKHMIMAYDYGLNLGRLFAYQQGVGPKPILLQPDADPNAMLGIGITTTPTARLDVNGTIRFRSLNTNGSVLTVDGNGNLGLGTMPNNTPSWQLGGNSVVGLTNFGTLTNFDLPFYTNGSERMRISTAGNVGIGTASPAPYKLTIVPSFNNDGVLIDNQNNGFDAVFQMKTSSVVDNDAALFLDDSDGQKLKFALGNTSNDANRQTATRMVLDQNGNVGIGSTAPNEKLTVQGNISTTGIGYFSTISGLNLNGAASGSIVTVDGVGKLGFGTLTIPQSQWLTTSAGIYYGTSVGIGMLPITNTGLSVKNTTTNDGNVNGVLLDIAHGGNAGSKSGLFLNYNINGTSTSIFRSVLTNVTGNSTSSNPVTGNAVQINVGGSANIVGFETSIPSASTGTKMGMNINVSGAGGSNNTGLNVNVSNGTVNNAALFNGGNVGIGTTSPNERLVVVGNQSTTGIGYFSSISGLALNGAAAGSIVTVDGVGKLGFGTLTIPQSQWLTTTAGIYYSTSVGIGMLPQTATGLSIKSAGNATKPLRILNSATSNPMFEIDEGSGGMANVMIYNNAGVLVNQIGGTLPSFFNGGGSVGIGTNAPTQGKLVVVEDAGTRPGIFVSGGGATSSASISIGRNTTSDGGIGVAGSALTTLGIATIGDFVVRAETRDLILSSKNNTGNIRFGTGNLPETEKMTILNNGNVGIGVVAPSEKLTIMGNQSTTGIGYFSSISGLALNGALAGSIVTVDGVGRLGFGTLAAASNYWEPNGSNKIYTNSFVGIGNSNPTYPLHIVVGNTNDNAVFVNKNVSGTTGNQVAYSANFSGVPTSGMKIGYESNITPTANEAVRGMSSTIINNLSINDLFASFSYINNNANGKSVAFRAVNDGSGVGDHIGFSAFDNSTGNGQRYGVHSEMIGTGATATNYALYGKATGAGANNYAGYFDAGNVYMKDNLVIGNLSPTAKLDVNGTVRFRNFTNGILTVDGTGLVGVGTMPSASQWTTTANGIFYKNGNVNIGGDVVDPIIGLLIDKKSTNNTAISVISDGAGWGSGIRFGNSATSPNVGRTYGIYSSSAGRFHFADVGANADRMIIDNTGNVGIGALLTPTAKLDIQGDAKIATTLTLAGLAGGNFSLGVNTNGQVITLTSPVNSWKSTTSGITFTDDKIAIGTSTVAGAARFKVAGDGSMGGMVITSQSLVNPISTSNTIYTTLITVPVYIPAGTNTVEFNVIGSSQGGGNINFQLEINSSTSAAISMNNTTPTIGNTPQIVNIASFNGWQTLKINVANSAGNTSAILHGYTVIVKD